MKLALLLLAIVAVCAAHVCLCNPPPRGNIITAQQCNDNFNSATVDVCKQNVNIQPFDNDDSTTYGTTCGGNLDVENANLNVNRTTSVWNTAGTPTNLGVAGTDSYTIKILTNAAHESAIDARGAFHIIDFAPDASDAADNDKFIPIAIVLAGTAGNTPEYIWDIPEWAETKAGVLRVTYATGLTEGTTSGTVGANPFSNPSRGNIAAYYTQCADVSIDAPASDGAARFTYF